MPAASTARSMPTTIAATTAVVSVQATRASTSPRPGRTSPTATDTARAATARSRKIVVTSPPTDSVTAARTISTHMIPAHSSQRSCVRSGADACRCRAHTRATAATIEPSVTACAPRSMASAAASDHGKGTTSVEPTGSPAEKTTGSGASSSIDGRARDAQATAIAAGRHRPGRRRPVG